MKSVLLIQYASLSHINAGLKVAEILRESGYEIFYFIHEKSFRYIDEKKYKVLGSHMLPFREKYNKALLKEMKLYRPYRQRLQIARYRLNLQQRKKELLNAITQVSPSVIIADTFASLDFPLLYNTLKDKHIKFFYLETTLSPNEIKGVPYLTGKSRPDQPAGILMEHLRRKYTRAIKRIWQRILYLGYDNYSTIKKIMRENKLPPVYSINQHNYMNTVFNNVHTLVVAADELEFNPSPRTAHRHVLGFLRNEEDEQVEITDPRLLKVLQLNKKIIYVSFGTIFVHRSLKTIVSFLYKLNTVLTAWPHITAIVSLGGAHLPESALEKLSHLNIFKFVPQASILKYCHLFITHGGLNSIKESLYQGVPMLVYPLAMDQIGNARKVAWKELGLMGDIEKESSRQLSIKIRSFLNNDTRAQQVMAFAENLNRHDTRQLLTAIIENNGEVK